MKKQTIATAYHEAGHAVISFFVNAPFKTVTIVPAEDYLGLMLAKRVEKKAAEAFDTGFVTPGQRARIENLVIVTLAGGIAERRYRGRYNHVGRESDMDKAVHLVLKMSGSGEQASAYLKWLDVRAHEAVDVRWDSIEAVTQALLVAKTMTQAEVIAIILKPVHQRINESA